jgi:hypothetical protein
MKNISALIFGLTVVGGFALAQVTGAFNSTDIKDTDVIAAAKFAVKTKNTSLKRYGPRAYQMLEITKAEAQVLEGLNYRICIDTQLGDGVHRAEAMIHKDIKKRFSLINWDWKTCGI